MLEASGESNAVLPTVETEPIWVEVPSKQVPSRAASAAGSSTEKALERVALRLAEPSQGGDCAVLYFHGFGSDQMGEKATFFRTRALATGLAFASFDFRGHGSSEGDLLGLTLSRNLEDALAARNFLSARGYARVVLLGSSMGGLTALWHGAHHPVGVVAGYFIAPALTLADTFLQFVGEDGARRWRRDGFFRFDDGERSCELGWEMVEDFRRFDRHQLARIYRIPSLIFQGKLDERVPWRMVQNFVEQGDSRAIELHLFADGEHRLSDRKELLWGEVANHLARLEVL